MLRGGLLPLLSHRRNYIICNCWRVRYIQIIILTMIFSAPSLLLERHIFAKSFCFCQNIQSANPEGWSSFLNSACSKSTQLFVYGICFFIFFTLVTHSANNSLLFLYQSFSVFCLRVFCKYRIRANRTPAFYQNLGLFAAATWSFLANFCSKILLSLDKFSPKMTIVHSECVPNVLIKSGVLFTRIQ